MTGPEAEPVTGPSAEAEYPVGGPRAMRMIFGSKAVAQRSSRPRSKLEDAGSNPAGLVSS